MPFEATLPAELWLIILDMVIAAGITLLEQCDHTSFPDIYAYLRSPAPRAPFDNSYGQLRLVCRTFNTLVGGSPHYIMKSFDYPIPTKARAVYIIQALAPSKHVRRLLEEPSICYRLVNLDALSNHPGILKIPTTFDLLCGNLRSLPNLRCLTLRFAVLDNAKLPFWAPLNDAFPLLRRLVLTRYHGQRRLVLQGCDGDVTFRNVELLILGHGIPYFPGLHFPRLRHVALDASFDPELKMLARSPLESALFEQFTLQTIIDLKFFPFLRFLRIRAWEAHAIVPVGDDHPLEHLWLVTGVEACSPQGVQSIIRVARSLPGVSRLTLEVAVGQTGVLERDLQMADNPLIGVSISSDDSHIVLKRTRMASRMNDHPMMSDQPRSVERRPFLRWVRSKFRW